VKFIDEASIYVTSGDGGRGCVSFRREKFIPRGGPDGGDGGKGGDVFLKASSQRRTLYQFQYKKHHNARKGSSGLGKQKTGKAGADLEIEIPIGTLVFNAETGELIKDFITPNELYLIAKGGIGGRGNARFKTSKNRTPRFAQPGEPGQSITLKLELKLLADVGIIGFPNAGKSTLISSFTSARPKIGSYPFTTLTPNLGVAQTSYGEPFVVADVPGLIEGAHTGTGLGVQFLKHIERTRILIHLIDTSTIDIDKPLEGYQAINKELKAFNKSLKEKPQIIVLNKLDLPDTRQKADSFQNVLKKEKIECISAATTEGIDRLIRRIETELVKFNEDQ
jgi:GTP-binding protein